MKIRGTKISMKMSISTRPIVLSLYRQLLRYGENLQLTDKDYFFYRVRSEYAKNKTLQNNELIRKQITRGEELLKRNRFR